MRDAGGATAMANRGTAVTAAAAGPAGGSGGHGYEMDDLPLHAPAPASVSGGEDGTSRRQGHRGLAVLKPG